MICRRCGAEIGFIPPDAGYMDEGGSMFCPTYEGDPVAPMIHAPMLSYGSDAANGSQGGKND
jgi:hypothetical protein